LAKAASVDDATPADAAPADAAPAEVDAAPADATSTASIFFLITRETLTFEDIFVRLGLVWFYIYFYLPKKYFNFLEKSARNRTEKKALKKRHR
jgi:hypothetical protein